MNFFANSANCCLDIIALTEHTWSLLGKPTHNFVRPRCFSTAYAQSDHVISQLLRPCHSKAAFDVVSCCVQVDLSQVWITLTSVIVAFSFIFKEAASNLYQSILFLFTIHPLDVGDALLIDTVYYKVHHY